MSPDLERPCGPPAPGPSALLACVLHEYACSGARRPGRIRTTWPPDLSAPFINSLLGVDPAVADLLAFCRLTENFATPRATEPEVEA